jgi:outer membrane lipoprotein-sorting protein
MKKIWIIGLFALGFTQAAPLSASEIWAKVSQTIDSSVDLESHISGKVLSKGKEMSLELIMQGIPALELTRIQFIAPKAMQDNVLILEGNKVWNYLSLPNQIIQTSQDKMIKLPGMPLDFGKMSDLGKGLAQQDVNFVVRGEENLPEGKTFLLEGRPKTGATLEFSKLRVWVLQGVWRVAKIQAFEGNTVKAELSISNFKTNQGLKADALRTLPQDAERLNR